MVGEAEVISVASMNFAGRNFTFSFHNRGVSYPAHREGLTRMAIDSSSGILHMQKNAIARGEKDPKNSLLERSAPVPAGRVVGEERRRSQRVLLRMRANIHVNLRGKQVTLDVRTLSVNPFGAMIVAAENLPSQTRLVLENCVTHEKAACKVVRSAKEMPEGFHVPVEFDTPTPKFWMIDFPPEDWKAPDDL